MSTARASDLAGSLLRVRGNGACGSDQSSKAGLQERCCIHANCLLTWGYMRSVLQPPHVTWLWGPADMAAACMHRRPSSVQNKIQQGKLLPPMPRLIQNQVVHKALLFAAACTLSCCSIC